MTIPEVSPPDHVTAVGNLMKVDAVTAEVVTHLRGLGIRTILLKGPSIGQWLYDRKTDRLYADTDLLVAPRDGEEVASAMEDLGFEVAVPRHELDRPVPAVNWIRDRTGSAVDVHVGITGAGVSFEDQWEVLSRDTGRMTVGGAEVEVLAPAARAVHLVLHMAQHGRGGRSIDDLLHAVDRIPHDLWREAVVLAERLEATPAFVSGLRLHEDGAALAERLGLPDARSVEAILREEQAPLALGLKWLSEMPGLGARLRLIRSKVFPPPGALFRPGERRTVPLVVAAYARRWWQMTRLVVPAWKALRRARRAAASESSGSRGNELDETSQTRQQSGRG